MHRTRDLLVRQRTQLVNMIRGLLAEFGVDIPKGIKQALVMARRIVDGEAPEVPIERPGSSPRWPSRRSTSTSAPRDRSGSGLASRQRVARRLMTIPGIGPVGATALAASVTDRTSSAPGASSPRGWDSRHSRTPAVARSGSAVSPRWATSTCDGCWSWA